eukprot:TRINITY_DN22622_c0_g1_i1.p1 TRINITY_DN22622_c0_g1~~TRINITY_DN22622_c0_g1_i1.p1  ORF type:complete len:531 (+),score=65.47 TRINITY_DN22622_c0_g1_i1:216-1595(+)
MSTAFATSYSGGIWWDPAQQRYSISYNCGHEMHQCCAYSRSKSMDMGNWEKPDFGVVRGTNIIQNPTIDGSTVWLDLFTKNKSQRWKMAMVPAYNKFGNYSLLSSADGVHWNLEVNQTGPIQDRSTIFYNPFRKKWIYSIKDDQFDPKKTNNLGRYRAYREVDDLFRGAQWQHSDLYAWTSADANDIPMGCGADPHKHNGFTQLYNLDAVGYESVMVGFYTIFNGKYCGPNSPYNRTGEWDQVAVAFSRDGFHWSRPIINGTHPIFLGMNNTLAPPWVWNKANVQSVGGGFLVFENALKFFVGGRTGVYQIQGNGTVGTATMRRDGFASISGGGRVTTKPLMFNNKQSYLFVNVEVVEPGEGFMFVEIVNATSGLIIPPYVCDNTIIIKKSSTKHWVQWKGEDSVAKLRGHPIQITFLMGTGIRLYSFWVSQETCGTSNGYVAAGGRGFQGPVDNKCQP